MVDGTIIFLTHALEFVIRSKSCGFTDEVWTLKSGDLDYMQAVIYRRAGGPAVLEYVSVPRPVNRADELLIRVEAISIEGGELASRRLREPDESTRILGGAAAGTVVAVGSKVSKFEVGDRVTSFSFAGSYAEYCAVPAATCWKVPVGMDMKVASTIPVAFGTAELAFTLGDLKAGDTVLIQGATGGVGIAAVQLASIKGARVLGTGRDLAKLERLSEYGLSASLIVDNAIDINDQISSLGDCNIDLLVDMVGGRTLQSGMQALREGGRAVVIGIHTGQANTLDAANLLVRRHSVHGCFLGPIIGEPGPHSAISECIKRVASDELRVPIDAVFSLSDAAAAHAYSEESKGFGRVVMVP